MRGKERAYLGTGIHSGITPACAGKRPAPPAQLPLLKDHPRVCGEKDERIAQSDELAGSPPRMRGKGNLKIALVLGVGITPAHAGKSRRRPSGNAQGRDHPRMCGEKSCCGFHTASILGSPPHVRGKVRLCRHRSPCSRITPACAGKSTHKDMTTEDNMGSPPHVRGKVRG